MSDSHQLAVATIVSSMIGKDTQRYVGEDELYPTSGGVDIAFRGGDIVLCDTEDNCVTLETIVNHVSHLLNRIDGDEEED